MVKECDDLFSGLSKNYIRLHEAFKWLKLGLKYSDPIHQHADVYFYSYTKDVTCKLASTQLYRGMTL